MRAATANMQFRAFRSTHRRCAFHFPGSTTQCCAVAMFGKRYCRKHDRGQP